jgi:hypothetical protein
MIVHSESKDKGIWEAANTGPSIPKKTKTDTAESTFNDSSSAPSNPEDFDWMDVVLTKSSSDSVEKTGHIQRRKRKKT